MVHRPADSRLLTNLINAEKEYSKHLDALLDASHVSLASLSAYAASSPPPVSHIILAVAASLASADDALRRYALVVNEWQDHLSALKDLEDEVGNIMRDREILVTRLIKASKSQKPPSNATSTSLTAIFPSTPKITAAHAELQACEAHLAQKERDLTAKRASAVREGLTTRCHGMAECGWAWGDVGREGMAVLDGTRHVPEGGVGFFSKPLPELTGSRPSSEVFPSTGSGNTTPVRLSMHYLALTTQVHSESNTQLLRPTLQIPPAHSISEFTLPTSETVVVIADSSAAEPENATPAPVTKNDPLPEEPLSDSDGQAPASIPDIDSTLPAELISPETQPERHPPDDNHFGPHQEADEPDSSAEEDLPPRPVKLIENSRFANMSPSASASISLDSHESAKWYSVRRGGVGEETYTVPKRKRKGQKLFGSLRELFKLSPSPQPEVERAGKGRGGGWRTRTDRNLRALGGAESSAEEETPTATPTRSPTSTPRRLKKERTRKGKEAVTKTGMPNTQASDGRRTASMSAPSPLGVGAGTRVPVPTGDTNSGTKHRRTMSVDGRSTLPFKFPSPPPHSPGFSVMRKGVPSSTGKGTVVPSQSQRAREGSVSLMSIVADVTKPSKDTPDASKTQARGRGELAELNMEASRSEPIVSMANGGDGEHLPSRPLKSPLRSALRTPSPALPLVPARDGTGDENEERRWAWRGKNKEKGKEREVNFALDEGGEGEGELEEDGEDDHESDYETGHEVIGDDDDDDDQLPAPQSQSSSQGGARPSLDNSTTTETPAAEEPVGPTQPRKSVRVSLRPMFSPTPPVIEETGESGGSSGAVDDSAMKGWKSKIHEGDAGNGGNGEDGMYGRTVWQDSSDEEVDTKVKKLLRKGLGKRRRK